MGCGQSKHGNTAVNPVPVPVATAPKAAASAAESAPKKEAPKAGNAAPAPVAVNPVAVTRKFDSIIPYPPLKGPAMKEMAGVEAGVDLFVNIYYPEDIADRTGAPLIVYQHGRGSTHHVYQTIFSRWVAMGYIVIFPYNIKSAVMGEEPPWPSTALDESPDGIEMRMALKKMHSWAMDSSSEFYNRIDTKRVSLAGHSMGGKSCICAGAELAPQCMLLHSPSCSSEGSEVYSLTKDWTEDRFAGLSKDKTPIMLVTSDEDLYRDKIESIFNAPGLAACPRFYLQFSKEACEKVHATIIDHFRPPRTIFSREFIETGGGVDFQAHCYMGAGGVNDPSLKWGEVFLRLFLDKKGDRGSKEWGMLFGDELKNDPMLTTVKVSEGL